MKKVSIKKYGAKSVITSIVLCLILWGIDSSSLPYSVRETAGFISIVISTVFVFLGIRHFRDNINQGLLKFEEGLKIGFIITLYPAALFGIFTYVYIGFLNQDFVRKTYEYMIAEGHISYSGQELTAYLTQIESQKSILFNPWAQGGIMFATVLAIGLVVTIISSIFLKRTHTNF